MFLNKILTFSQNLLLPIYKRSIILQNIDYLIGINIFLLFFLSIFAQSDNIGYFGLFAVILTVIKLLFKSGEKFELNTADKFLLVYFILVLISVAGSSLFYLSLKGFFKTLTYLGFYVSLVHYLKDNKQMIKYLLLLLGLCAGIESLIAVHQNFLSVSEISGWQDMSRLNPEEVMTRVYGTLKPLNPNLFGGYMLAIIPASLMCFIIPYTKKHYVLSVFGLLIFLMSAFTIILTGCRGAYIGLFIELLLMAVLTYRWLEPFYKKIFGILLTAVSIVTCFVVVTLPSLRARILSIFAFRGDSSNSFRFNVYNSCLQMFKDNWLLGIGCGNQNFREIYGLYMKTGFDALSAYNIYLETAVESGIFALLAFIGFLFYNIKNAIEYILKNNNEFSYITAIALISIIGILVHGFVDTVFFRPQIQFVFWLMIAIIRVESGNGLLKG